MKAASKKVSVGTKPAARKTAARKIVAKRAAPKKVATRKKPAQSADQVLSELKTLAKELNKAAKGLGKKTAAGNPKQVSVILGNVERMTAEAADKSLAEAESAKSLVATTLETLGRDWNRKDLEVALRSIGGHLTNIMVAQEFQDLAGQALRKAMKALVGAIIVVEVGGTPDDQRLSQKEVDILLKSLMS
ncbi:MAG TPA: hypothetical protein VMV33_16990 [Rhodocyclaceae bacterium]|nr:hypothetical protein [Rhodocyclaceae bacterium]